MAISYIFSKETFLIFQETKPFYISGNRNLEKNSLCFRKENFFIFQGTKTLKKFFIFQETKLSNILGRASKALKTKIYYISP